MPTIDQLEPAVVASDDDVLPVSQSGITRGVTRSQLLAGTQKYLALTPGLLGRNAPGLGQPQQVTIGNGLKLADGILSSQTQFSTTLLDGTPTLNLTDLIPIGQGGLDRAVTVRQLLSVAGADISDQLVAATGTRSRLLGQWVNDAVYVEAFGAVGDGVTDDTNALNAAINSGRPVLLGPKCYRVDGQWTIQATAILMGTPGLTVLRRTLQNGGAWINVTGKSFRSTNVIFDAGSIPGDSWSVLVAPTCETTLFQNCDFINGTGSTLGCGFTIQARDGLAGPGSSHTVVGCRFQNNARHGLWIQAAAGADINDCIAITNGAYGICLDYNDPTFQQRVRRSRVVNCRCGLNDRGISVGNYNETNLEPPRWGLKNPDASDVVVSGNICSANRSYGIAVSGERIKVSDNQVLTSSDQPVSSGILCNSSLSLVCRNTVVGAGQYGIDSGGSVDLVLGDNLIQNFLIGVNAGGSQRVEIRSNKLIDNQRGITLFQVETDGNGVNFGMACHDILIENNSIAIDVGGKGISVADGSERVQIYRNRFLTTTAEDSPELCLLNSDSVSIEGNSINGSLEGPGAILQNGALNELLVPEILDTATLDASITRVDSILNVYQVRSSGTISFIRVVNCGSGYTWANVGVTGVGSGATARAYVRDGSIVGIALGSAGNNYVGSTTSISITGDGQGATAIPFVGCPFPADQSLTLRCNGSVAFTNGVTPAQANWTGAGITVPAQSDVVWRCSTTGWQTVQFDSVDYLLPGGDGSVSFQSSKGDIRLRPGPNGNIRLCSQEDTAGFLLTCGHGSPENVIIAPPGSDYRNLDGGVGQTLWVKRTGIGNTGWFALA